MDLFHAFSRVMLKNAFIRYHRVPAAPSTVMISTTNRCNLRCRMCGVKSIAGPRGFMDRRLFQRVIDQCRLNRVHQVALHGIGEPLLHRDLIWQIDRAKAGGLYVFFSTNGQLLNPEKIRSIVGSKLDAIRISIEGATKETYESIRSGGRFETFLGNLSELRQQRDRQRSSLKIFITSIVMRETVSEISRFKERFAPFCDDVYFTYLANPGGQVSAISRDMYVSQPGPASPCRLLWNTMVVDFDGSVTVCCLDFNRRLVVGNLCRDDLADIWHNATYNRYRTLHRLKRFDDMPLCGRCNKDLNSAFRLLMLNLRARWFH